MSGELTIIENQLTAVSSPLQEALAGRMPVERLIRTVVISCERTPKLLQCDRQTIINGAMTFAVLGLEVDGVTGQGFLLPFKRTAQPVIGYKGYNTLGARSGLTITGEVICEGDEYDFDEGEGWVRHKRSLGKRGRMIGAWAKAAANDRPAIVKVLGMDDLLAVKAKSPGASRSDSPWNDPSIGFPAMCEKTVKRRLARSLPLNIMQMAARMDEAFDEQGQTSFIGSDKQLRFTGGNEQHTPAAADLGPVDFEARHLVELEAAADRGSAVFKSAWLSLSADAIDALAGHKRRLYDKALAADERPADPVEIIPPNFDGLD